MDNRRYVSGFPNLTKTESEFNYTCNRTMTKIFVFSFLTHLICTTLYDVLTLITDPIL